MSAALALILLAEAVSPCAPALGGGAKIVRESGPVDAAPFERLGPAVSVVTRPTDIQQTGAESKEPDADEPAEQCAAVRIQIV
jgi:hypothetical protein